MDSDKNYDNSNKIEMTAKEKVKGELELMKKQWLKMCKSYNELLEREKM